MKYKQLFVFGPARSGTSIARNMIFDIFKYPSHGEGHILQIASKIRNITKSHLSELPKFDGISANRVDNQVWLDAEAHYLRTIYNSVFLNSVFMDKTPSCEAAFAWPLAKRAFPDAAIIFCIRHPAEVIISNTKKFDNSVFRSVCEDYVSCMSALNTIMNSTVKDDLFIIDHRRTYRDQDALCFDLLNFLDFNEGFTADMKKYLNENWSDNLTLDPKNTQSSSHYTELNESDKLIFDEVCGKYIEIFENNKFINKDNFKETLKNIFPS